MTRAAGSKAAGSTREAILAAAASEFAAHGFAGASVDSIAAQSGFNKAMIFYHFKGKQALYVEILRDVFRLMGARTGEIAASDREPGEKIAAFIEALDDMAATRPYMPAMVMREMAEGATRLDLDTVRGALARLDGTRLVVDRSGRTWAVTSVVPHRDVPL